MILVVVKGNDIQFATELSARNRMMSNIDGLKLSKSGVEKQFPDLIDNPLWREIAIERFKENIKSLKTEKLRARYIADDLVEHGYTLKRWRQNGYREEKF